jgi:hypothetical protein
VIVRFVDIGGIVDRHFLNLIFFGGQMAIKSNQSRYKLLVYNSIYLYNMLLILTRPGGFLINKCIVFNKDFNLIIKTIVSIT